MGFQTEFDAGLKSADRRTCTRLARMAAYNWNWAVLVSEPYLGWLLKRRRRDGDARSVVVGRSPSSLGFADRPRAHACRTPRYAGWRQAYVDAVPEHPAARADVPVVFRSARACFRPDLGHWLKRDLPLSRVLIQPWCASASTQPHALPNRYVPESDSVPPLAECGGARFGHESDADVSPHTVAARVSHHRSAADESEFLGIVKNTSLALTVGVSVGIWPPPRPPDRKLYVPGLRGVHGRDSVVSVDCDVAAFSDAPT